MKILFATTNNGKVLEAKELAKKINIDLISLNDLSIKYEVPNEDGNSYQENAEIKVKYYYNLTKMPCISDDSGLEVFSLGGIPGINTANFGGSNLNYNQRMELLLDKLVNNVDRKARYVCHLSYYDGNEIVSIEEYFNGKISDQIDAGAGFGYDPIFIPDGYDVSVSQLKAENVIIETHRIKAFKKLFRL